MSEMTTDEWHKFIDDFVDSLGIDPNEKYERTKVEVIKKDDEKFGKVGFIGNWSHNNGDVHFEDGTKQSYWAWDLKEVI